jgi:hypothetical protein
MNHSNIIITAQYKYRHQVVFLECISNRELARTCFLLLINSSISIQRESLYLIYKYLDFVTTHSSPSYFNVMARTKQTARGSKTVPPQKRLAEVPFTELDDGKSRNRHGRFSKNCQIQDEQKQDSESQEEELDSSSPGTQYQYYNKSDRIWTT